VLTPEQLVSNLQKENLTLREELEQSKKDLEDFEKLAFGWKKGYLETEKNLKIKLINANQTIEQLEKELEEFKKLVHQDS
jgi:thymidylate kinase